MSFKAGAITSELKLDNSSFKATLQESLKAVGIFTTATGKSTKQQDEFNKSLNQSVKEIDEIGKEQKEAAKQTDNLSSSFKNLTKILSVGAIGLAVKSLFDMGAAMEQTAVSFEVLTGSKEAGDALIQTLNDFANVTPFVNDQVLKAGKSLVAFGFSADSVQKTLTMVGDVAAATGKDFNELTLIYGKARTAGKLYAEDLNQLTEAGIPILDELGKVLGVNAGQIKKLASEGKIGFKSLEKAFENMTGEGGRFEDMMKRQSKTAAGMLSTIEGKLQMIGIAVGTELVNTVKPAIELVMNSITALTDAFSALDDETKETIITATKIATALTLAAVAVKGIAVAWKAVSFWAKQAGLSMKGAIIGTGIGAAIVALSIIMADIITKWKRFGNIVKPFKKALTEVKGELVKVGVAIKKAFTDTKIDEAKEETLTWGGALDVIMKMISSLGIIIAKSITFWIKAFKQFGEVLLDVGHLLMGIATFDKTLIKNSMLDVEEAFKGMKNQVMESANEIKNGLKKTWEATPITVKKNLTKTTGIIKEEKKKQDEILSKPPKPLKLTTPDFSEFNQMVADDIDDAIRNTDYDVPLKLTTPDIDSFVDQLGDDISESLKEMEKADKEAKKIAEGIKSTIENIVNTSMKIYENSVQITLNRIKHSVDKVNLFADVATHHFSKNKDKEIKKLMETEEIRIDMLEESLEAELQALEDKFDAEVQALENAENEKMAILRDADAEKLAMIDNEFARKMAILEKELEAEKLRIDAEKELRDQEIDQQSSDQITADLVKLENEQDANNQKLEAEKAYQDSLNALMQGVEDQKLVIEENSNNQSKEIQSQHDLEMLKIEKAKDKRLLDQEIANDIRLEQEKAASDARVLKAQEDKAKKEKDLSKAVAFFTWQMDLAGFEASRRLQIAQNVVQTATAAMAGFASGIAVPVIGPIVAAANVALALAAGASTHAVITSVPPPLPPAELFFKDGGIAPANKNIVVGEEGPEILSLGSTSRITSNKDSKKLLTGSGGVEINIENFSPQGNFDREMVQDLAVEISELQGPIMQAGL
jgi:tape measure domain-containing protein